MENSKKDHIKNAGLISFFTLISRILGLIRDILMAISFGASFVFDAFIIGFSIPNLVRRILGEGLFSSIFTPALQKKIYVSGFESARRFASQIFSFLLAFCVCSTFFGLCLCLACLCVTNPSAEYSLTIRLTCIMLPYAIFICCAAFLTSILNAVNHFVIPALTPIVLNIVWIMALFYTLYAKVSLHLAVYIVSASVVIGGIFQFFLQIPILKKKGLSPYYTSSWDKKSIKPLFALLRDGSIGVMIIQINVLLDRIIAWLMAEEGSVTVLYIANRFVQFPLALIGIAIATVALPHFTQKVLDKNIKELQTSISQTLSITFLLSFPATVGLFLLAPNIIALFYGYKSFTTNDIARTANVLCIYSLSVWIFCLQQVISKVFYSLNDAKTPMKISCISVVVNVVLNLLLVKNFSELGLAVATSCSATIALILSLYYLKKKLPFSIMASALFIIKVLLSSSIMGLFISQYSDNTLTWYNTLIIIITAILLYFVCIFLLFRKSLRACYKIS